MHSACIVICISYLTKAINKVKKNNESSLRVMLKGSLSHKPTENDHPTLLFDEILNLSWLNVAHTKHLLPNNPLNYTCKC